jgi:N-methylhydantoinase A
MLGIPEVIVPAYPGITSALGLLASELKYDSIRTQFQVSTGLDLARLNSDLVQMEEDILRQFAADSVAKKQVTLNRYADARYVGQGYELRIELPARKIDAAGMKKAFAEFHKTHEAEYGHAFPASPIEIVNVRVAGTAASPQLEWPKSKGRGSKEKALVKTARTKFRVNGALKSFDTAFYRRADLPVGKKIPGPAIVLQLDTTTVVPPNWSLTADPHGNLILTAGGKK